MSNQPHAGASVAAALALCALLAPAARAAEPAAERLYVSDETGGNVVIVDPQAEQVVTRIPVGKRPRGIELSLDHRKAYVALTGSPAAGPNVDESKLPPPDHRYDGIGVVDLKTQRLVNTYPSGIDPETFALSHDGNMLYVSNEDSGQLSAIDLAKGTLLATVSVGSEPEGVAVSDDDKVVYVTCETSNAIYVLDAHRMTVLAQIPSGKRPRAIYLSRRAHRGFATDEFGAALTEFSTDDYQALRTIALGDPKVVRPMGIVSHDGKTLYVTTGRFGALLEVDADTGKVERTIEDVGARPWGVVLSRDGTRAYTANGPSGDVSVVDLKSGRVAARIKVGGSPWGVALGPAVRTDSGTVDAAPAAAGSDAGIWKAVVPAPGAMHGEFGNDDPIGLSAGVRIRADCSINWVDPDEGRLYCFSSATSLVVFLEAPRAYLEKARAQWRQLGGSG